MEFDFDSAENGAQSNTPEYTVSELSGAVKKAVETQFSYVRVRGELGRVSTPASGHVYLDLKDEKAVISGVIWRAKAGSMSIRPEQGLEVIVTGKLTTFPGQSKYQIVIDTMEPAGQGALMALLEERKKKLANEGLFDESAKQKIPFMPKVIGIVTSPSGAVIRDMMHGFRERFPVHVLLWPVRVQGENSAREITAAIDGFNEIDGSGDIPRPDLIIVARGGGSLEDLWSFNEEIVARSAAKSAIPLISAVGHETDWTLIDYVADARAPTPTKAAEWAVPDHKKLVGDLLDLKVRHVKSLQRTLSAWRTALKSAIRGLPRLIDIVGRPRQRLDAATGRLLTVLGVFTRAKRGQFARFDGRLQSHLLRGRLSQLGDRTARYREVLSQHLLRRLAIADERLKRHSSQLQPQLVTRSIYLQRDIVAQFGARGVRAAHSDLAQRRVRLTGLEKLLNSLGYQNVLARGFAIVRNEAGDMVRHVNEVKSGDLIGIELADGSLKADVVDGKRLSKTNPVAKPADFERDVKKSKKVVKTTPDDQGSLF